MGVSLEHPRGDGYDRMVWGEKWGKGKTPRGKVVCNAHFGLSSLDDEAPRASGSKRPLYVIDEDSLSRLGLPRSDRRIELPDLGSLDRRSHDPSVPPPHGLRSDDRISEKERADQGEKTTPSRPCNHQSAEGEGKLGETTGGLRT